MMFILIGLFVVFTGQVFSCDQDAIQRCTRNSFPGEFPEFKGIPRADEIHNICSLFLSFKRCTDPLLVSCDNQVLPDILSREYRTIAETMCGEYYNDILSTSTCWNRDDVQNGMTVCATSHRITTNQFFAQCSELSALSECMAKAISMKCGNRPVEILNNILHKEGYAITYPNQCDVNSSSGMKAGILVVITSLLVSLIVFKG